MEPLTASTTVVAKRGKRGMHMLFEVSLPHKGRQHEHLEWHRIRQFMSASGDVAGATHLQPMHQVWVRGERHNVEVLAWYEWL